HGGSQRTETARPHNLEMAKLGPAENTGRCRIGAQRRRNRLAYALARPAAVESDKIDDNPAAELSQAQLPRNGIGGGEIGAKRGALRRTRALRGPAIDIDQDRSGTFGDMHDATAWQRQRLRQRRIEQRVNIKWPAIDVAPDDLRLRKHRTQFGQDRR